jgi:hypothetical protein
MRRNERELEFVKNLNADLTSFGVFLTRSNPQDPVYMFL